MKNRVEAAAPPSPPTGPRPPQGGKYVRRRPENTLRVPCHKKTGVFSRLNLKSREYAGIFCVYFYKRLLIDHLSISRYSSASIMSELEVSWRAGPEPDARFLFWPEVLPEVLL